MGVAEREGVTDIVGERVTVTVVVGVVLTVIEGVTVPDTLAVVEALGVVLVVNDGDDEVLAEVVTVLVTEGETETLGLGT